MKLSYGFTPGIQVTLSNRQQFYPRVYFRTGSVLGALGLKWTQQTKVSTIEDVRGSKIHPITGETMVDKSTRTAIVPVGGISLLVVEARVNINTLSVSLESESAQNYEIHKRYNHTLHPDLQSVLATVLSGRCDLSELERYLRRVGGHRLRGAKCFQRLDGFVCQLHDDQYALSAVINFLIDHCDQVVGK